MKNLKSFLLFFILLFSLHLWAAGWSQNLPLNTSEDKALAFLKVRALIPSMADGAIRYGFDPVTLFEHQIQIEKMMSQDSHFQNLKNERGDLLEFSIYEIDESEKGISEKEKSWKNWQDWAAKFLVHHNLITEKQIVDEIKRVLDSNLFGKSQGIVVGLSSLVPGNLKKQLFAAPLNSKIDILVQHLPEDVISHGFSPSKLGWSDTSISKSEVISRLKSAIEIEQRMNALLIHHFSSVTGDGGPKAYLQKWDLDASKKKTIEQWFNSNISKMIPNEVKIVDPVLIMREVPPVVSIFRGFAGNDCSTICSFPFVNSPNEFTFLVYDSKGGIKGYVQGTKIMAEGADSFYLHTIAGPRFSKNDAISIINVFHQERERWGFKEILLPSLDKVDALVNFLPVREAISEVISKNSKRIQYGDIEIREGFKKSFNITKNYDDASSNTQGFKVNEASLSQPLKIVYGDSLSLDKVETQMDRNSLILMLLQMGKRYDKNRQIINALAPHAGIEVVELKELISTAENFEKLNSSRLIEKMEAALKARGFNFKEGYFKKNIAVISLGLLRSPDVLTDMALAETVVSSLIDQRELDSVERFLSLHPELFRSEKIVNSFFRAFYIDIHEAQFLESSSLKNALNYNPKAILKNSELLEILTRAPKAREVLIAYVETNPIWATTVSPKAGRAILASIQENILLRDKFYKLLLSSKTEMEFESILSKISSELSQSGLSSSKISKIRSLILSQAVDHYIQLKPQVSIQSVFYLLSLNLEGDILVQKALRKLLPLGLVHSPSTKLNSYLAVAAKLKKMSSQPEKIDKILTESLLARPDRESLPYLNSSLFPQVEWSRIRAPLCQKIFY